MRKYGFVKHSLVDYPGEVASVIFFSGCNFTCSYCHNKKLALGEVDQGWSLEEIFSYLEKMKGRLITGVCVTGGEPTLKLKELQEVISRIKDLGLKVKLDTNGSNPDVLNHVEVDYVAMDVKTSLEKYLLLTSDKNIKEKILRSISLITEKYQKGEYEFRTTMYPPITTEEDMVEVRKLVNGHVWKQQEYKEYKD